MGAQTGPDAVAFVCAGVITLLAHLRTVDRHADQRHAQRDEEHEPSREAHASVFAGTHC
jgi:hypothetical protein